MFDHVSKHLDLLLKNSILSVWKHDQTLVRVFDIQYYDKRSGLAVNFTSCLLYLKMAAGNWHKADCLFTKLFVSYFEVFFFIFAISCVWLTALTLGCITNFGMPFLVV